MRIDQRRLLRALEERDHKFFCVEITLFATLLPNAVRTLVVPIVENTWRACIEQRLEQMRAGSDRALLVDRLANARYALDGKVLAAAHDVMALTDATLRRLPMPGLPGGMRRSDAATHLASLSQSDLIAHAKALGVSERQVLEKKGCYHRGWHKRVGARSNAQYS